MNHQPGNCEAFIEWSADCNTDGIVDYGQILDGSFEDLNSNGVLDTCEIAPLTPCGTVVVGFGAGEAGTTGNPNFGQSAPPAPGAAFTQVSGGIYHSAGLLTDGTVVCWGSNASSAPYGAGRVFGTNASGGPITDGTPGQRVRILGENLTGIVEVSAGELHTAARRENGSVLAWGDNAHGQLNVPPGLIATQISAGSLHTLALRPDGSVVCWGTYCGQTPNPASQSGFIAVAAGYEHSLAWRGDGSLVAWGRNDRSQGVVPTSLPPVHQADAGVFHNLVLALDGVVYAWGDNRGGQCGGTNADGTIDYSAGNHLRIVKHLGEPLDEVVAISAGGYHSLALRSDGTVVAWGGGAAEPTWPHGQTTVPNVAQGRTIDIEAGYVHSLIQVTVHPADCDSNGLIDCFEISINTELDSNEDGTLDVCECGPDTDSDGTANCLDLDDDGDGTPDLADHCPLDAAKTSPGTCGCGTLDVDADSDGIIDCLAVENVSSLGLLPSTGILVGDDLGAAVATDGTFAIVGLPLDDVGGKADAGTARIYVRSGSTWSQVTELTSSLADAKTKDYFGTSVAIHGDVAVVGVPAADVNGVADAGSAYVFRRLAIGNWVLEQKLTRISPAASDRFGSAVAVRGNFIAVGAPLANAGGLADSGETAVFVWGGSSWLPAATVSGSPLTAGDRHGAAVGLGGDVSAPVLVAGATGDDETGRSNCGAVYVHALASNGTIASTARLVSTAPLANAGLGQAVAIDAAGERIVAGAPLADPVGVGTDAGAATAWRRVGATWSGQALTPPGQAAGERFGTAVAIDPEGGTAVVGSPFRTQGGIAERGSAVVFARLLGGTWRLHDRLTVEGGTSGSRFGTAVAIGSAGVLIGGPKNTPPAGGAVATFALPASCIAADTDGDGTGDLCDDCPNDPNKIAPGTCGCGTSDADTDGDGRNDCFDPCPLDAAKIAPGTCGCGVPETDSDGDGTPNCNDADDDNDGSTDGSDGCPLDPSKTSPGLCGCGTADTDSDSDGTPNCNDLCPSDPAKVAPGICGCGTVDVDADADGLFDCLGQGPLGQLAVLPAAGVLTGDDFGAAIAADGATAIVGLPLDDRPGKNDAGSARILDRTGGAWTATVELIAADAKGNDQFGLAVALAGDVAVVGAPLGDVGTTVDAGAAYVFRRIAGAWSFEQKLTRLGAEQSDRFGSAVAVRGGFIAVGAPLANALGQADSGEVTVFASIGGVWTPTFVTTSNASGDRFGSAVALGGNAATPLLVASATGDDEPSRSNCGALYVYALTADGLSSSVQRLVGAPAIVNAGLGATVAVDATGTRIAAGAPLADLTPPGTDVGSVTVWRLVAGSWTGVNLAPPDRIAGERFGTSVAFRGDGLALVAGSPFDSVGGIAQRGSAAVFTFDGLDWRLHDRLTLPAEGTAASRLGTAAAFTSTGILVGAPKHTPPVGGTVREFAGP